MALGLGLGWELLSASPVKLGWPAIEAVFLKSGLVQGLAALTLVSLGLALASIALAYARLGKEASPAPGTLPEVRGAEARPAGAMDRRPTVGFISLRAADIASIEAVLARYSADWPEDLSIRWPEASAGLADELRRAIALVDRKGSSAEGVDGSRVRANAARGRLEAWLPGAPARLARFVRRTRNLAPWRAEAIERYLVNAHYDAFQDAAWILTWEGLRAFEIDTPEEWRQIFTGPMEAWRGRALHPGIKGGLAWVGEVDGKPVREVVIRLPHTLLARRGTMTPRDFALWAAPGLELHDPLFEELPPAYSAKPILAISKTSLDA